MEKNGLSVKRHRLLELFDILVPDSGIIKTALDGVRIYRVTESSPRQPLSYDPSIVLLASGQKNVYLGNKIFNQNSSNYLMLSVPLPVECEINATKSSPIIGMSISINPTIINEIILQCDDIQADSEIIPVGINTASITEDILDTEIRLLQALLTTRDTRLLGPMIIKELIYKVSYGVNGDVLRALAYRNRRFYLITRALAIINERYHENLNIESLASDIGMSASAFFAGFKAVTGNPPLQYIKKIRLHKARDFMMKDGLTAVLASLKVGYESPSQFSREYKRLFGTPPAKSIGNELMKVSIR